MTAEPAKHPGRQSWIPPFSKERKGCGEQRGEKEELCLLPWERSCQSSPSFHPSSFPDPGNGSSKPAGWGMELQTKVGSGDGQHQTGTAHLWLPQVPGAQGVLPARKKGTEIPLFQAWSCWECSSVENTTSKVWMSPVPQGCPGRGRLNVPRQAAERLQIKSKCLKLIEFCVGTAHSGQDGCELGELLRCIKRTRHCIPFKGRFMNHPEFTFRGLLFLVKLSKPMLLGFSLCFNQA